MNHPCSKPPSCVIISPLLTGNNVEPREGIPPYCEPACPITSTPFTYIWRIESPKFEKQYAHPLDGAVYGKFIPITLEYYLGGDIQQITKSLYFDIQTSKLQQKEHYMIEINSIYDYTSSGQLINNISLMDDTVEI